jgi:hypothetical protein
MSRPPSAAAPAASLRAWIVFCDGTDLRWLAPLRRGFRHCFALLHDGHHWVSLDPLASRIEVQVAPAPADFDLPAWFAARGHRVVAAPLCPEVGRPAPWAPFTCVETCKRLLGLRDRWVITPWQLYRRLLAAGGGLPA